MLKAITRRDFLRQASVISASAMMPQFLHAYKADVINQKVLVVVQLTGGNDALNTVVPFNNDLYYKLRPQIAIARNEILPLNDETGLHNSLIGFKKFYDNGMLSILNNVGYPGADLSHFRSMDIWQSASGSDEYFSEGWIGRYLDQCTGCKPYSAIEIDDSLSLALKGVGKKGFAVKQPAKLHRTIAMGYFADISRQHHHEHEGSEASYLYKTLGETIQSADYIYKTLSLSPSAAAYPQGEFAAGLKNIASLISSGCETQVYYLSLSGFDTHVQQPLRHARVLSELNDGLEAFVSDLNKSNLMDRVLIMGFSEFGRRVRQNASAGTDHGKAGNVFFISKSLKQQGLLNKPATLENLDNGDIPFTVDFRKIYATVIEKWLGSDSETVLNKKFDLLNFI